MSSHEALRIASCALTIWLSAIVGIGCVRRFPDGAWLYGGLTRGEGKLGLLDWPPPPYTNYWRVPDRLIVARAEKLGDAFEMIGDRLVAANLDGSTFTVGADGFAVATGVRCIGPTGMQTELEGEPCLKGNYRLQEGFSFRQYLDALFGLEPGHFRMLVITLTSKPFSPNPDSAMTFERAAEQWSYGSTNLPAALAEQPLPPGAEVTVLVYEFERRSVSDKSATLVRNSALTGKAHVLQARLFAQDEIE